jgi:hypothetical protein
MNRREFLKTSAAIAVTAAIPMDIMATETKSPFIDFAEKNFKINHWEKGLIPYESTKHHKELAKIYDDERFVLVKKYRQGGFTTMSVLYALHQCLTKIDFRCAFISKYDSMSRAVKERIINPTLDLMSYLKPDIKRSNSHLLEFEHGSRIDFRCASNLCGCGVRTDLFIFDEAAFIGKMDELYAAIYPCASMGGKIFLVSTPNRPREFFYKTYEAAMKGKNKYKVYAPSCFEHPNYTPEKIALLKGYLGEKGWKQECLAEF